MATYLMTHPHPATREAELIFTPLGDARGLCIWDARRGQSVLQVTHQGVIQHYAPGPWESRLLQVLRRRSDYVQLTLDLAGIALADAVSCQHEAERQGGHFNPLEELGVRCLRACQQQEHAHGHG
jgi:hypothetical protein